MHPSHRHTINQHFSAAGYQALLDDLAGILGEPVDFRVAESPVFVPADLTQQLLAACDEIGRAVLSPTYFKASEAAIPPHQRVPGAEGQPTTMVIDFAVCQDAAGRLFPQVIEMQGFPSLFCYQTLLNRVYRQHYPIPEHFSPYLSGYDDQSTIAFLNRLIKGKHAAENVVLLEIEPEKQKTRADFQATALLTGVQSICLSKIIRRDRKLFYHKAGREIPIHRIYNRVIFDELEQRPDLVCQFNLTEDVEMEWVCHPNWYFRMSKYSLPLIQSQYIPESHFVHQLPQLPDDLENWVLKPLYSFAGSGVIVDVQRADIEALTQPEHYLLQRKVAYSPVLESPEGGVKVELRMMVFLDEASGQPQAITNLARMSRGKLIGVRYNQDFNWVGGSSAFFELESTLPIANNPLYTHNRAN